MITRLAAAALIAIAGLSACSSDDESAVDDTNTTAGQATGTEGDTEGGDSEGVMTVDEGIATSTDGRFSFPVADGWQAYPAPLDQRVNITVLLISDVNNAEFAANLIGTWADPVPGVPTDYEGWRSAAGNVFTGEGVVVEEAQEIEIDGMTVQGLEVTREADGMEIKQLVYPVFTDEGFQEIAFSASPEVFEENIDDVIDMISEITLNF